MVSNWFCETSLKLMQYETKRITYSIYLTHNLTKQSLPTSVTVKSKITKYEACKRFRNMLLSR